jgi:S-methylmethionine-dependent homocysteine/selenocysteine methylase
MTRYRHRLPQLADTLFLSDGGLETTLIFHEGIELPAFASFTLLDSEEGTARLRRYFAVYADIARRHGLGAVLESATWRASADWGARLGYDAAALARLNRKAIDLLVEVRHEFETEDTPIVISGNLGPRGDGYRPESHMTAAEAERYHLAQIRNFADTDADMVSAFTLNYVEEAIGIVRAARAMRMPVTISFTLETDGRLPSGDALETAIGRVDAATDRYAEYFMINCAHPTHFEHVLAGDADWVDRIRGVRANASCKSHAELDAATELDIGNPAELGRQYRSLRRRLPRLSVVGGCCGTDHRHVESVCLALAS